MLVLLSASVERVGVSRMRDFLCLALLFSVLSCTLIFHLPRAISTYKHDVPVTINIVKQRQYFFETVQINNVSCNLFLIFFSFFLFFGEQLNLSPLTK